MAELFNKVKQEIGKGISAVGIKSKEVLESMKIKKQIDTFEEQIELAMNELGHLVYPAFTENNFDQTKVAEKCASIAALYKQAAEKEEELYRLILEAGEALGKIYCSKCKREVAAGSKYCNQCGEKVPEKTEE